MTWELFWPLKLSSIDKIKTFSNLKGRVLGRNQNDDVTRHPTHLLWSLTTKQGHQLTTEASISDMIKPRIYSILFILSKKFQHLSSFMAFFWGGGAKVMDPFLEGRPKFSKVTINGSQLGTRLLSSLSERGDSTVRTVAKHRQRPVSTRFIVGRSCTPLFSQCLGLARYGIPNATSRAFTAFTPKLSDSYVRLSIGTKIPRPVLDGCPGTLDPLATREPTRCAIC